MTTHEPTWSRDRWRLLAEFEVRRDEMVGWYGLSDCSACDGSACSTRTFPIPPLGFDDWPACPISLLRAARWQFIVALHNASRAAPIDGWPHRYAAWVVDGLAALNSALEAKQAADIQAAQKRS